ncbi:type II CAAX prenyl endopeptidase Rce1 family protein [Chryseomicrobium aureum]|uniref:CPBP family glutamic-type intramembrane protease n=1 Tax=Chryseomicrobium aureum TaxID=1441723 RepID=UPI001EF914A0|nr:CPBP family glutamic-type intramembrane protease [Chryseomicrobium aureum]MBM7705252.1 membrane protease YdiL (CAAX protease family) [Chryseomicrobium aureum]
MQSLQFYKVFIILAIAYSLFYFTFQNASTFWYFYSFTILFLMGVSLLYAKIEDEVQTLEYLLLGVGYGTLTYLFFVASYWLLDVSPFTSVSEIHRFLDRYGPTNIWHFILLFFIIAPAEEFFWRGFVQQYLKKYLPTFYAVLAAAFLFAGALVVGGFIYGAIAGLVVGILWGFLYEWKKSMPLLIVTHSTALVLLFLILPIQ